MTAFTPLPIIDDFLRNYHIGQVIFVLFLLAVPAGIVKKSAKITAINLVLFGLLFMVSPAIDGSASLLYAIVGIALLVVGPMVYTTATR